MIRYFEQQFSIEDLPEGFKVTLHWRPGLNHIVMALPVVGVFLLLSPQTYDFWIALASVVLLYALYSVLKGTEVVQLAFQQDTYFLYKRAWGRLKLLKSGVIADIKHFDIYQESRQGSLFRYIQIHIGRGGVYRMGSDLNDNEFETLYIHLTNRFEQYLSTLTAQKKKESYYEPRSE